MISDVPRTPVPLEIACDESGYEGEKLIGTSTDVFAHASVRMDVGSASACMQELRDRIRSPATEYKANHVLREKHRAVLRWLLGPAGPLRGYASVFLIDKAFYIVSRLVDLLVDNGTDATKATLYREGPPAFGAERWESFLESANILMRTKDRQEGPFLRTVAALQRGGGPVDAIMEILRRAGSRVDPAAIPPLDPLGPAIVRAVVHWSNGGTPVSVVHDQQNMLSATRIAQIEAAVAGTPGALLTGLRLADSRWDPRIQVADVVAGTTRKIASDALNGRGDPQLTALLRPFVDPSSIWADDRSWSMLG